MTRPGRRSRGSHRRSRRRRLRCRRRVRAGSRSASAVPRSNVGEVETATDPSTVPTATAAGTGHHRLDARWPSGIRSSSAAQRQRQARQPPPVVEPGCGEPTRQRTRVGDECLDGVRVAEAADRSPEGHDRQNPGDPMLGPARRQQDPDQRENGVGCQVGERLVRSRWQRRARARRQRRRTSERSTAQPSFTLRPGRAAGTTTAVATASITSASSVCAIRRA